MSKIIRLRKGLDIRLSGEAERNITRLPLATRYGISPDDFTGFTAKLLVKAGDVVKAGTPLYFDKNRPEVIVTSPVSGRVAEVNRGEKRKIINVVIETDQQQDFEQFEIKPLESSTKEDVTRTLLESGMWTYIIQRPYGVIANPHEMPKAIFVSGFDSAPLAPDMNFALADQFDALRKGLDVLKKLTSGKVHLGLREGGGGVIEMLTGVEQHTFSGPHPAGNVGVQIHHVDPINKGELVWTVDIQSVAVIGRLFSTGKVDMSRVVAVTGSELNKPAYVSMIPGAPVTEVLTPCDLKQLAEGHSIRVINGNVLTGKSAETTGYTGYAINQLTVITEGDKYELLGWAMPRFNKFSVSRTYFSWLRPQKKYTLDTNLNGGLRPFVVTGLFERYVPMDIYPMHLLKAIIAQDIDKMENLGIYEIIEEDFALCEFVDPSKNDIQHIVREGIDLMIKELN